MKKAFVLKASLVLVFLLMQTAASFAQTPTELIARAKTSIQNGHSDAAINDLSAAINLQPDNAEAYLQRSLAYLAKQSFDQALADAEKVLKIDTVSAEALNVCGLVKINTKNKDYDGAIVDFTMAIGYSPAFYGAYFNRGLAYGRRSVPAWKAAQADFTKAIELSPQSAEAYFERAWDDMKLDQWPAAEADYMKALSLGRKDVLLFTNLSYVQYQMKKFAPSAANARLALEIDPTFEAARSNLKVALDAIQKDSGNSGNGPEKGYKYYADKYNSLNKIYDEKFVASLYSDELLARGNKEGACKALLGFDTAAEDLNEVIDVLAEFYDRVKAGKTAVDPEELKTLEEILAWRTAKLLNEKKANLTDLRAKGCPEPAKRAAVEKPSFEKQPVEPVRQAPAFDEDRAAELAKTFQRTSNEFLTYMKNNYRPGNTDSVGRHLNCAVVWNAVESYYKASDAYGELKKMFYDQGQPTQEVQDLLNKYWTSLYEIEKTYKRLLTLNQCKQP